MLYTTCKSSCSGEGKEQLPDGHRKKSSFELLSVQLRYKNSTSIHVFFYVINISFLAKRLTTNTKCSGITVCMFKFTYHTVTILHQWFHKRMLTVITAGSTRTIRTII